MLLLRSTHIDMREAGSTTPARVQVGHPFIITITMKSPFTSASIQGHSGGQMLPWKALWMALAVGEVARFPLNPNGSPAGITAVTTTDGRATILMPHPERVVRTANLSWHPRGWPDDSPWLRTFRNARTWVG